MKKINGHDGKCNIIARKAIHICHCRFKKKKKISCPFYVLFIALWNRSRQRNELISTQYILKAMGICLLFSCWDRLSSRTLIAYDQRIAPLLDNTSVHEGREHLFGWTTFSPLLSMLRSASFVSVGLSHYMYLFCGYASFFFCFLLANRLRVVPWKTRLINIGEIHCQRCLECFTFIRK